MDSVHKSFSYAPNKLWSELKGLFISIDKGKPSMKINTMAVYSRVILNWTD